MIAKLACFPGFQGVNAYPGRPSAKFVPYCCGNSTRLPLTLEKGGRPTNKRGAKVAFGGIFLDAVLSTKRHKALRLSVNWVVLGIAAPIPLRPEQYCSIIACRCFWRAYRKEGHAVDQSQPHAAAAMARLLAEANPDRTFWLVGDSAYVNTATLQGRPKNLQVIGPLPWKAARYERPEPPARARGDARARRGSGCATPRR